MSTFNRRSLNKKIFKFLKDKYLRYILERVTDDSTLDMQFRGEYIDIYYRGGKILNIKLKSNNSCLLKIDSKYIDDNKTLENNYLLHGDSEMQNLIEIIPKIKEAMDLHYAKKNIAEREIVQFVIRANNYERTSKSTDFIVTDLEYSGVGRKGQIDLIAFEIEKNTKTNLECNFAFIEAKHGNSSLTNKSGLIKHLRDMSNFVNSYGFSELKRDSVELLKQKIELNLVKNMKENMAKEIIVTDTKPMFIVLLSDYKMRDNNLQDIVAKIDENEFKNLDIRFAIASFMGYGLYKKMVFKKAKMLKFLDFVCSD